MRDWYSEWPDYWWVDYTDADSVIKHARSRYRSVVAFRASTVTVAVVALVVGELFAISGLVRDGTSADDLAFPVTVTALAVSFIMIVASALGELVRGMIPPEWRRREAYARAVLGPAP
jgi:hypothetical protein